MSSASNIGMNDCLALASSHAEALRLRAADNDIRIQMQRKAAANGGVVTDISYSIGADGQMYVTGATVQASKRTLGPKTSLGLDDPRLISRQNAPSAANDNRLNKTARPAGFGDILPPQLAMSSLAFAQLQEQKNGDSGIEAELRAVDAGVRSHERQHFFAAGGLASGTPRYEFTQGPDGRLYATAGEVRVQTTATSDPEKAARDAAGFAFAATAPGDASTADLATARNAYAKAASSYLQANRLNIQNVLDLAA